MATFWMAPTPFCQDFRRFDSIGKREAQARLRHSAAQRRSRLRSRGRGTPRISASASTVRGLAWSRSTLVSDPACPARGRYVAMVLAALVAEPFLVRAHNLPQDGPQIRRITTDRLDRRLLSAILAQDLRDRLKPDIPIQARIDRRRHG